ncbi:putative transcription factor C2C2-YABBY family [Helianthus annuus]|uniref:Transcription factor C2C2-YABBY family n=1 Tax=Helianthus annuus TaxID=4232 RepID=A0A9K3HHY8_HELAN|nr:putative transcription factor C2C2-YABBY family [Helianthus annuus]
MNFEAVQAKRIMNMDPPVQTPSHQHLCYVRCNFCKTLLAVFVVIPCKKFLDTVTVKCGNCCNLSFLTIKASHPFQSPSLPPFQADISSDFKRAQFSSSSSSTSNEPEPPKVPFVVKPPERKHRIPSAYNRFMKEEIQRIKASNPQIPHREAFSTAAKSWAGRIPNGSISESINTTQYRQSTDTSAPT